MNKSDFIKLEFILPEYKNKPPLPKCCKRLIKKSACSKQKPRVAGAEKGVDASAVNGKKRLLQEQTYVSKQKRF